MGIVGDIALVLVAAFLGGVLARRHSTVVTMSMTPFATRLAPDVYSRWRKRFPSDLMRISNLTEKDLRDHVVLAGYGPVGGFVAGMLDRLGQPFVLVDNAPSRIEVARSPPEVCEASPGAPCALSVKGVGCGGGR